LSCNAFQHAPQTDRPSSAADESAVSSGMVATRWFSDAFAVGASRPTNARGAPPHYGAASWYRTRRAAGEKLVEDARAFMLCSDFSGYVGQWTGENIATPASAADLAKKGLCQGADGRPQRSTKMIESRKSISPTCSRPPLGCHGASNDSKLGGVSLFSMVRPLM